MYHHHCVPMTDNDCKNLIYINDDHLRAPDLDDQYFFFQNYNYYGTIDNIDTLSYSEDDEKSRVGGTLESIVNQATRVVSEEPILLSTSSDQDNITTGTTMVVNEAEVPLHLMPWNKRAGNHDHLYTNVPDNTWEIEHTSTNGEEEEEECYMANEAAANMNKYVSAFEPPFTCTEEWMTMFGNHQEDDSVFGVSLSNTPILADHYHPHSQKKERKKAEKRGTIISRNKRSKATILHNKAEQKRRNKINQRMEALRKLIPTICYKTDKATMLDQVIEYIKQLQTQLSNDQMMIRNGMMNNMSYPMMIPMPYYMFMQQQQQQQQQQMSRMEGAQMGMGVGLGSMQTNLIMYPNISTGTSRTRAIVHPTSITPSSN